jgi:hypothetical protein
MRSPGTTAETSGGKSIGSASARIVAANGSRGCARFIAVFVVRSKRTRRSWPSEMLPEMLPIGCNVLTKETSMLDARCWKLIDVGCWMLDVGLTPYYRYQSFIHPYPASSIQHLASSIQYPETTQGGQLR